jgi:uncharacterized protein with HEPN domain
MMEARISTPAGLSHAPRQYHCEIEASRACLAGRESYTLRRAAERAVQIVSEAAKSLPPELLDQAPDVPWSAIIGIGNVLRHDYQHIDDRLLWDVVTVHLPELRPVIAHAR